MCRRRSSVVVCLAFMLAGCGGKGTTKFTYETPVLPFGVSFKADSQGIYAVSAGIVTPFGTFAIEHDFESRDEFTYIVLRNRDKGIDQVFKIAATGYVDIHAVGDHRIRMNHEGNKWIIETQSLNGTLDIEVRPSNAAIARVDFGENDPDFVVTTDHKLVIESHSMFTATRTLDIDTLKALRLVTPYMGGSKFLIGEWKPGVTDEPIAFRLNNRADAQMNFDALAKAVDMVATRTQTESIVMPFDLFLLAFQTFLAGIYGFYFARNKARKHTWLYVFNAICFGCICLNWFFLVVIFTPSFFGLAANVGAFVATMFATSGIGKAFPKKLAS